jgi:serine/threonine protein kinase
VFISADFEIKIGSVFDMERARSLNGNNSQPEQVGNPYLRWLAPELLTSNAFSEKSAVWSFGLVLWELFNIGKRPYDKWDDTEVVENVLEGFTLPCEPHWPKYISSFIARCWAFEATKRPSFSDAVFYFRHLSEKNNAEPTNVDNTYCELIRFKLHESLHSTRIAMH